MCEPTEDCSGLDPGLAYACTGCLSSGLQMRAILLLIVAPVILGREGTRYSEVDSEPQAPLLSLENIGDQEWDIAPDVDATGHHLFNTVNSLSQL